MCSMKSWEYDSKITIRIQKSTKDRLWEEAEGRDIQPSECIRGMLDNGILVKDQYELLPQAYQERIENHARKIGKEPVEVLLGMLSTAVQYAMKNMPFGF